jgi:hypothetical protein
VIVLNLICIAGHRFDGWFASVDAYQDQANRHLVNCPSCNSSEIQRLPSTPHVAKHREPGVSANGIGEIDQLMETLQRMADSSEDVGDLFADEARRIHYDEAPIRNIKGHASGDEVKGLLEEGIQIFPIPKKDTRH